MSERLAKFMARSGVCSRRRAEEYIRQKRVTVNGEVVDSPAFNVEGTEKILFDGEKLPEIETTRLWLYYKPVGLLTTHRDDQNRPTVFDSLPPFMPRVVSVGRLDLNSEGLLLLTNNGELSRKLELPENGWSRLQQRFVPQPASAQGRSLVKLATACKPAWQTKYSPPKNI
ncbi:pseudouridine synthase [Azospirillum sp. CAG:239]|nr:pseudouridine synthase [Azospirillum sp. CAG:239]